MSRHQNTEQNHDVMTDNKSFEMVAKFKYLGTTYLLTYLLTPWCRILFEKLIVTQLIKNILLPLWNPKVHHRVHKSPPLDPSRASRIQFALSIPTSLRSILILSSHLSLGLPSALPFGPPNQNPVNTSPLPHACHMSRPPHPPWCNYSNNIRWRIRAVKFIVMQFSLRSVSLPFSNSCFSYFFVKRHLQSFADLWPTLMGFSIYI
jgi:hypothetical protein